MQPILTPGRAKFPVGKDRAAETVLAPRELYRKRFHSERLFHHLKRFPPSPPATKRQPATTSLCSTSPAPYELTISSFTVCGYH
jgi:hypothetical protein